jgi:hypothetical protein
LSVSPFRFHPLADRKARGRRLATSRAGGTDAPPARLVLIRLRHNGANLAACVGVRWQAWAKHGLRRWGVTGRVPSNRCGV